MLQATRSVTCVIRPLHIPPLSRSVAMASKKVAVEVISDVVCPWCWVGKRSIEAGAAKVCARYITVQMQHSLGVALGTAVRS